MTRRGGLLDQIVARRRWIPAIGGVLFLLAAGCGPLGGDLFRRFAPPSPKGKAISPLLPTDSKYKKSGRISTTIPHSSFLIPHSTTHTGRWRVTTSSVSADALPPFQGPTGRARPMLAHWVPSRTDGPHLAEKCPLDIFPGARCP